MIDLETPELAVSDPDLSCVAVPSGAQDRIDALFDAYSLQWILKLDRVRALVAAAGARDDALNKFGLFLHWLVALSVIEIRSLVGDPIFMAWATNISREARLARRGQGPGCDWFARHIDYLPILFLGRLDEIFGGGGTAVTAVIPGDRRIAPLGLGWRLRALAGESLAVTIRREGDVLVIERDGEWIACIPPAELTPESRGGGVRLSESGPVVVETRAFVVDGRIEVLEVEDFPELADRRLPEEVPWGNGLESLDRELGRSIQMIREVWPDALCDLDAFWKATFPMSMPTERWNSASTGDLPFCIQITVREEAWPYLLAESIIHEVSHVKLDLAMELAPLIENDSRKIYLHPWRPDLRPMSGVLLGAHAFLAVMVFYRQGTQLYPENGHIQHEYELRRKEVGQALSILGESAKFTSAGAAFYQSLQEAYGAI